MADVVFFSSQLTPQGEVKLIRRDFHIDYDPPPVRVQVVIHDAQNCDPTLAIFHEPQESDREKK